MLVAWPQSIKSYCLCSETGTRQEVLPELSSPVQSDQPAQHTAG